MEKVMKIGKELLPYIIILVVVVLIRTFIFSLVVVNGPSMNTTLRDGDIMILDKMGVRTNGIDRFDIVVIKTEDTKIIKRVIGLPGETLEYKDNVLYINGEVVEDIYGSKVTYDIDSIEIPEDTYYVLGDNRTNSVDSRVLGPIKKRQILGHATFIVYPFNRFGEE